MNYVGIDIHKRYSVLVAQDERGRKLREARIEGNSESGFVQGKREGVGPQGKREGVGPCICAGKGF